MKNLIDKLTFENAKLKGELEEAMNTIHDLKTEKKTQTEISKLEQERLLTEQERRLRIEFETQINERNQTLRSGILERQKKVIEELQLKHEKELSDKENYYKKLTALYQGDLKELENEKNRLRSELSAKNIAINSVRESVKTSGQYEKDFSDLQQKLEKENKKLLEEVAVTHGRIVALQAELELMQEENASLSERCKQR